MSAFYDRNYPTPKEIEEITNEAHRLRSEFFAKTFSVAGRGIWKAVRVVVPMGKSARTA